jgi:Rod binding domain-containing protein
MTQLGAAALPPVSEAALPREVREGSAEDKKTYRAALGFERMLVHQLAEQMAKAAKAGAEDEDAPAGQNVYEEMLSDALADSVVAGGGLGLASELYKTLRKEPVL